MGISSDSTEKPKPISLDEKKFDWVKRYCRRYGDPSQATRIIEEDGSSSLVDFSYLKTSIVPHMLKRLLGEHYNVSTSALISSTSVAEMAAHLLANFVGLISYAIRYRTALWLAEEIAIQPPHPWLVTPQTRLSTVRYDIDRARAHIDALKIESLGSNYDLWHHYTEIIHHCSVCNSWHLWWVYRA